MNAMSIVERLRAEYGLGHREAGATDSPLATIARLAQEIAATAPHLQAQADEIQMLAARAGRVVPSRDAVVEAIEEVAGDDLSSCQVSRLATAVMRSCGGR